MRINVGKFRRAGQQRLDFGAKQQSLAAQRVMQRLLSEAVSCQQQTFSAFIPECEREHPAQLLHALGPILLVQVNDHLGVSAGVEAVATSFQCPAQLWEVVDLPIEDDPEGSVLVVDGLMSRRQIDDTQSAHARCCWGMEITHAPSTSTATERWRRVIDKTRR